jgi:hypothetical protein
MPDALKEYLFFNKLMKVVRVGSRAAGAEPPIGGGRESD